MTDEADWKLVGDMYKTEGIVLEAGTFVDSNGNSVVVTDEDVKELYQNITDPIPFCIGHPSNDTVGYAMKFKEAGGNVLHSGIINDADAFSSAMMNGHTYISPEISREYDSKGRIISQKIDRLAFVPNPAMPHTATGIKRFAFSAPEIHVSNEDKKMSETTPTAQPTIDIEALATKLTDTINTQLEDKISSILENKLQGLKDDVTDIKNQPKFNPEDFMKSKDTPPAEPPKDEPKVEPKVEQKPEQLPKEFFEDYARVQAELQRLKEQNDRALKTQYSTIIGELKTLGFDKPENLVSKHGDLEQKIESLQLIKENYVKNAPMNSSKGQKLSADEDGGGKQEDLTVSSALNSFRMNSGMVSDEEKQKIAAVLSRRYGKPIKV